MRKYAYLSTHSCVTLGLGTRLVSKACVADKLTIDTSQLQPMKNALYDINFNYISVLNERTFL